MDGTLDEAAAGSTGSGMPTASVAHVRPRLPA
jgi:hypothetical protein